MKNSKKLPMHVRFFLPILEGLKQLDGSGTPSEVKDVLAEMLNISEEELEEKLKNGMSKIDNQISWSKIYLTRAGLLDASEKDLWRLTEKGLEADLTEEEVIVIFKKIHSDMIAKGKGGTKDPGESDEEEVPEGEIEYKRELLELLKSLPPGGFERVCQMLLRASGFKKVNVTGKSGDGGIDGVGILEMNPLVSLKVIFQAKRYKDAVSSSQVRDFRGAMQGRAEKAIFITTGRFTQDAKKEAIREGVPPIELVDGDKLVELFEEKKLGLKPKIVYEVDENFFDEYR